MVEKKVLVIDDDVEFLEEIKNMLSLGGYNPIAIDNSTSALSIAQKTKPDVILTQPIALKKRQKIWLIQKDVKGAAGIIPFDYQGSLRSIKNGQHVFIDDGNIDLEVVIYRGLNYESFNRNCNRWNSRFCRRILRKMFIRRMPLNVKSFHKLSHRCANWFYAYGERIGSDLTPRYE